MVFVEWDGTTLYLDKARCESDDDFVCGRKKILGECDTILYNIYTRYLTNSLVNSLGNSKKKKTFISARNKTKT